jgi:hypothetical protein
MDVRNYMHTVRIPALTNLIRYDWEAEIDGPAAKSLDYFPLLHNGDTMFLNSFKSVTSKGKFTTVLSINEPDQCGYV